MKISGHRIFSVGIFLTFYRFIGFRISEIFWFFMGSNVLVVQSLWIYDPMDCSLPGFSVYGTFKAKILEWVAIPFSSESSQPRDQTQVSWIVGRFFTIWATREAPCFHDNLLHNSIQLHNSIHKIYWLELFIVYLINFIIFM